MNNIHPMVLFSGVLEGATLTPAICQVAAQHESPLRLEGWPELAMLLLPKTSKHNASRGDGHGWKISNSKQVDGFSDWAFGGVGDSSPCAGTTG